MRRALFSLCLVSCSSVDDSRPVNAHPVSTVPPGPRPGTPIALIAVADEPAWLSTLAAPLVARLAVDGPAPLMLVLGAPPDPDTVALVREIQPRRALFIQVGAAPAMRVGLEHLPGDIIRVRDDPRAASMELARRFWLPSAGVVAAPLSEPAAALFGALLAARRAQPLLLYDTPTAPGPDMETLGVDAVDWVGSPASWPGTPPGVRHMTPAAARDHAAGLVGAARNVVVVSRPESGGSPAAWLGPYVAWVRDALLVVSPFPAGDFTQSHALAELAAVGAHPQTFTLLADYDTIGTVANPGAGFGVEPFTLDADGRLSPFGVGRIPFDDRPQTSAMFARGLAFPDRAPVVWEQGGVLRASAAVRAVYLVGAPALLGSLTGVGGRARAELAAMLRASGDEPAGELLRDVRALFLAEHPEHRQVALAFRLWGDPELGRRP